METFKGKMVNGEKMFHGKMKRVQGKMKRVVEEVPG